MISRPFSFPSLAVLGNLVMITTFFSPCLLTSLHYHKLAQNCYQKCGRHQLQTQLQVLKVSNPDRSLVPFPSHPRGPSVNKACPLLDVCCTQSLRAGHCTGWFLGQAPKGYDQPLRLQQSSKVFASVTTKPNIFHGRTALLSLQFS